MPEDNLKYTEQDVRKILQKALDIQKRENSPAERDGNPSGEYSLVDIEQAAEEIGLIPEHVHQAAAELDSQSNSSFLSTFLGAETSIVATGRDQEPVDEETLQGLIAAMQTIAGATGVGNVHGSVCSWATTSADVERRGFPTEIIVRTGKRGTVAEVRERLGQLAAGIYGGVMGGVGLGAGLGVGLGVGLGKLDSGLFAVVFAVGTFVFSYGLSRLIFVWTAKHRRKETRRMLGRVLDFLKYNKSAE